MVIGFCERSTDRILIHLLLAIFALQAFCTEQIQNPSSEIHQNPSKTLPPTDQILTEIHSLLQKQEASFHNLQTLMESIQHSVTNVQDSKSPRIDAPVKKKEETAEKTIEPSLQTEKKVGVMEKVGRERREMSYGRASGVTVAKYKPAWTERFQFLSAVKFEADVTCVCLLPQEGDEGISKYVAVGDEHGRVYVFLSHGDLLVDFVTLSPSPITAMLSYLSVSKNETVLVTGHADGSVHLHRLWEMTQAGSGAEDWHVIAMEHVRSLNSVSEGGALTLLEVHQVGKMRYIVAVDSAGRICVYRENGTRYGMAESGSRPVVFLRQRLLFLTETGAGSLDLRSMTVRSTECEGLNGSRAVTYAFDATERAKGYGFTSEGDLIHFLLLGDVLKFECRVRTKRKSEIEAPIETQSIKGYLLVATPEKVYVYNTTNQPYGRVGGPRPLFYASLDEIIATFANSSSDSHVRRKPLIACNKDRLVVIAFGDGHVGMYKSNLPVYKAEFNTMMWSSPVLVFVLFLFGAWQFFGKKREAFAIWGSDDPLSGMQASGGGGSGTANPSSVIASVQGTSYENHGRSELRDKLRGSTRRYMSPSRYPTGGAAAGALAYRANAVDPSYRTGTDTNFRANTVDSGYRTGPEANFRAQTPESGGYPKRRDARFSSTQNVEEKIH